MKRWILAGLFALLAPSAALAVPVLQLDIAGGHYQDGSIVTSDSSFTVYAYATPQGNVSARDLLGRTFYLSVALTPETGPVHSTVGSFDVNGVTYDATADMTYGVPPIETNGTAAQDAHDLPQHGIYETFFVEVPFQFTAAQMSGEYNTQDDAGQGPIAGDDMFYAAFEIDRSLLPTTHELHFDLYGVRTSTTTLGTGRTRVRLTDRDVDLFAPPSHDAATVPGAPIPEPSAALVFAVGLVATRWSMRRSS